MNRQFPASVWDRLKNHAAFRVGTLYLGASWFLIEAVDTFGATPATTRRVAIGLAVGFIILVPAIWWLSRRAQDAAADTAPATAPSAPAAGTALSDSARSPRRHRRWAAAALAFCVLAGGLWAFRTRVSATAVPDAATHLAVLPFHATGSSEIRELGIGMVDLLSTALSDVGGIRTVPGRTVIARLRAEGGSADVAPADELDLAKRLGAASLLTGSITAFGNQVRLAAIIRTVDGEQLATAEVQGAQDNVLQLTDQLAIGLLRELWRTRAPIPSVRIAGLTTTSPQALRAYLRGEELMRAVNFDAAGEQFRLATDIDSTFALAWLRLAENAGWAGATETLEIRRNYMARALSHAARLPERERSFIHAMDLALRGSFEAFDSLDSYVRRYPDDPMGWFELGDVRYHAGYLGNFTQAEIIHPFEESTRLDPTLGVGLHHVLDMHLDHGDSTAFRAALLQFARFATPVRVQIFEQQAAVRWAPADDLVGAFARGIRPLHPIENRAIIGALVGQLGTRSRLDLDIHPDSYIMAMDSLRRIHGTDRYWRSRATLLRGLNFASMSRADSAFVELERWLPLNPMPDVEPAIHRALRRVSLATDGSVPADAVRADLSLLENELDTTPWLKNALREFYARSGDHQRAARYPLAMDEAPAEMDTAQVRAVVNAWSAILAGDTARGLPALENGIRKLGFAEATSSGVPWHELAVVLTNIPERRAQGIRMLQFRILNYTVQTDQAWLAIARALDAEGDRAGARAAYSQVLRLWTDTAPFRHAQREEVRQALIRLSGEGG